MTSATRRPRSLLHAVAGAFLVIALIAGGIEWVRVTLDEGPGQRRTPLADLNAAQVAAALRMPVNAGGIPVLTYHGVSDRATDGYTVTPAQLSAHLAALKRAGFTTVRLSTLEAYNRGEDVSLPQRPVVLTFDDGTESTWTVVDPLLRDYGFNAVGFLITGSLAPSGARSYYLDADQAEALAANGRWEFGGHTHQLHRAQPTGDGPPEPALDHRIIGPDGALESFDDWRNRVSADLERSQADLGAAVFPDSDPFHLHRLGIRSATTVEDLLSRIAAANPVPMQRIVAPHLDGSVPDLVLPRALNARWW